MIEIDLSENIRKVNKSLKQDFDKLNDMRVPMKQAGVYMIGQNTRNFESESTPDGKKWKSLKPATIVRRTKGKKKNRSDKILQDTGMLKRSVTMHRGIEVAKKSMVIEAKRTVGTVDIAKVHQLGSKKRKIPARPFLGFNRKQVNMVNRIFIAWIERILGAK